MSTNTNTSFATEIVASRRAKARARRARLDVRNPSLRSGCEVPTPLLWYPMPF